MSRRASFQIGSGGPAGSPIEKVNTATIVPTTTYTIPDVTVATLNELTFSAGGIVTLDFPAPIAGASFALRLTQSAAAGGFITWDSTVWWAGGVEVLLTNTADAVDCFAAVCFDDATWMVFVAGQDMAPP